MTNDATQTLELTSGGRAHYRIREGGGPDATPILLLHGSMLSMDSWEPVVDLVPDRTFLLVDLPGHGRTSALEGDGYSAGAQVRFVSEVAQALYPGRALHVVGHSMGGHVAFRLAVHEPARVAKLVLVASAGLMPPAGPQAGAYAIVRSGGVAALANAFTRDIFARGLTANALDAAAVTPELVDRYWQFLADPVQRARTFSRFLAPAVEETEAARLPEIAAPTLLLWGGDDPVYPPAVGEAFAQRIPHAELVVYEHCGHLLNFERPERLAADLTRFTSPA